MLHIERLAPEIGKENINRIDIYRLGLSFEIAIPSGVYIGSIKYLLSPAIIYAHLETLYTIIGSHKIDVILHIAVWSESIGDSHTVLVFYFDGIIRSNHATVVISQFQRIYIDGICIAGSEGRAIASPAA